ncbi:zinc-binding dehydrogenase [Sphingobium fuliginis]|nr:zinc-binding dehydrogenase [Sphingobium fuliginis]
MPINPEGLATTPTFFAVHPDGAGLARIGELVAGGIVTAVPVRPLPLAEAAAAHRLVEAGGMGEKIILHP